MNILDNSPFARHDPKIQVNKYWKEDIKGCKRDQACKYLHQNLPLSHAISKEGEKVDVIVECVDRNRVGESKETDNMENSDTAQKIAELEALIVFKNEAIEELKKTEEKLKMDNENNKEQAEKNKRVASNIYKELMELKSRK
jgi:hypothetical protein